MTVALLTSDDLKETSRENTQLAKLNELAAAVNLLTGGTTTLNALAGAFVGSGASVAVTNNGTGRTQADRGMVPILNGTYDTTSAAISIHAVSARAIATRSAGANDLENRAIYAVASGGQVNYAIHAYDGGDVALAKSTAKLGFYSTPPIARQTGVAVTAAAIHAALVNLGLITA